MSRATRTRCSSVASGSMQSAPAPPTRPSRRPMPTCGSASPRTTETTWASIPTRRSSRHTRWCSSAATRRPPSTGRRSSRTRATSPPASPDRSPPTLPSRGSCSGDEQPLEEREGPSSVTTTRDPYYDPFDIEIDKDPHPLWRRMREEAPLYRNDRYGFYALSRYDDVERGLVDWETYRSGKGSTLEVILANMDIPPG